MYTDALMSSSEVWGGTSGSSKTRAVECRLVHFPGRVDPGGPPSSRFSLRPLPITCTHATPIQRPHENDFVVQWLLDRCHNYFMLAIHGCFRSSVADFLSSGCHLSIERMKSRNNSFSSPSSTETLSSSEILGIVTLLEPPVQCPIELSSVYVGTISVTNLACRRASS